MRARTFKQVPSDYFKCHILSVDSQKAVASDQHRSDATPTCYLYFFNNGIEQYSQLCYCS